MGSNATEIVIAFTSVDAKNLILLELECGMLAKTPLNSSLVNAKLNFDKLFTTQDSNLHL